MTRANKVRLGSALVVVLIITLTVLSVQLSKLGKVINRVARGEPAQSAQNESVAVPVVEIHPFKTPTNVTSIYENDFSNEPGPEWNAMEIRQGADRPYGAGELQETPKDKIPYLGGFVEEPVELKLSNLPKHKMLRVSFDLFIIRCWDGSNRSFGVKLWDLDVAGKQNLIHTTFSNAGFYTNNNEQAFPDTYPCRPHPAWTGAAEQQSLGISQNFGDFSKDTSAVYKMSLTFPHADGDVVLRMKATMQPKTDKSWGLTNVKIEAVPEFGTLTNDELTACWKDLGDSDPIIAYRALWNLVAAPEDATAFMDAKIKAGDNIDATDAQMNEWAQTISTGDSQEADEAMAKFEQQGRLGKGIAKASLDAIGQNGAGAQERRWQTIAKYADDYKETATEMRLRRAKKALMIINTEASLKLAGQIHPGVLPEFKGPVTGQPN